MLEKAAKILPNVPSMNQNLSAAHVELAWEIRDGMLKRVIVFRPTENSTILKGPEHLEEIEIEF